MTTKVSSMPPAPPGSARKAARKPLVKEPALSDQEAREIRLRIVEALLPISSKYGINEPDRILRTAGAMEDYVIHSRRTEDKSPS